MYAARVIVVLLLILTVLVAFNPQARERVRETWDNIRPVVLEFMDNLYTAIRNLIAGNDSDNKFETPTPTSPGVNFQRIVTLDYGYSL
ncbi:MAG TPA: hypothetical protein VK249_15565 [Anaerolineales bacterium]|nr:hypothetical protein [Anaerolineales bacterium]